jgi:hypothetical protein
MPGKTSETFRDKHDITHDLVHLNAELGLQIGELMRAETYDDLDKVARELRSSVDELQQLAKDVAESD